VAFGIEFALGVLIEALCWLALQNIGLVGSAARRARQVIARRRTVFITTTLY
jgi:hypothetical protein